MFHFYFRLFWGLLSINRGLFALIGFKAKICTTLWSQIARSFFQRIRRLFKSKFFDKFTWLNAHWTVWFCYIASLSKQVLPEMLLLRSESYKARLQTQYENQMLHENWRKVRNRFLVKCWPKGVKRGMKLNLLRNFLPLINLWIWQSNIRRIFFNSLF